MACFEPKMIIQKRNSLKFLLFLSVLLTLPSSVLATDWSQPPEEPAQLSDLNVVFGSILDTLLFLVGLAFLIMIIIGGYQYLTAGDNPKNVEKASHTLTQAVAGLVIIIAAWFIIQIIQTITGLNLSVFNIVSP